MEGIEFAGLDEEVRDESAEKEKNVASFEEAKKKRRPFHYWKVAGEEYRLKLNTATIEKLESKYRTNLMNLASVEGLPALTVMLTIIQGAILPWRHGTKFKDVQRIYDAWVDEGGSQLELYSKVLMPTFAVSGFFTAAQADSMMESLEKLEEDDLI